jgi:hypothetical protein
MPNTFVKVSKTSRRTGSEPRISNSAVYDTNEERRPVAVNKYKPPIAPIRVNKAELMLEKIQRANPVPNIVARRMPPVGAQPIDPNYALYIELDRLATASVPKQPLQPLKIKSPFTEAMIEKYKQEEERNIREAKRSGNYVDFISPPESMRPELEEPVELGDRFEREYDDLIQERLRLQRVYREIQDAIADINQQLIENPALRAEPAVTAELERLSRRLNGLQNAMDSSAEALEILNQAKRDTDAENMRIKKKNAAELKNYENMYKLLNKTLPIQQLPGETDAEYRDRLISFKQETSNLADENEARVYEHKVFQRNLKRLINLPTFQIESLIKKLDGYTTRDGVLNRDSGVESMERVFQLNEIFPKVETQFIRTYGKDPVFRNPIETLYDFFLKVLEEPLIQEEEEDEILDEFMEKDPETGRDFTKKGLIKRMEDMRAFPLIGKKADFLKKEYTIDILKKRLSKYIKEQEEPPGLRP